MRQSRKLPYLTYIVALLVLGIVDTASADIIYVTNYADSTVSRITSDGIVSTFVAAGGVHLPEGIAVDRNGNLFVASRYDIVKVTPDGTPSEFAYSGHGPFQGVVLDSAGNIFSPQLFDQITKITPEGKVSAFATGLPRIEIIAIDPANTLYAANEAANSIIKITPDGTVSDFATGLNGPNGVAVDTFGNLFFASAGSRTINKISPTGTISLFASLPNGFGDFAFGSGGILYAVDGDGHSIDKVTPDGTVSTFATGFSSPSFIAVQTTPEPSSIAIFGITALALFARRRHRRP